jgi:hypothetical protein
MSCAVRPSEGIDLMSFANAVTMAVEQILTAHIVPPTRNDNIQFAISPTLAQPDILNYSSGIGAKICSKPTEPLKTTFSIKTPNICILLSKLQVRSKSFGWNPLFQFNISQCLELTINTWKMHNPRCTERNRNLSQCKLQKETKQLSAIRKPN